MSQRTNEGSTAESSKLVDEALHRLHDRELPPADRAAAEASLDEAARARLAVMSDVGTAVRQAVAGELGGSAALDMDALWGAIEKQIQPAKVIPFRTRAVRAVSRHPIWVSTGMAAAAALAVMIAITQPNAPSNGCEIESLDVTGASVTVMHVDGARSAGSTTVVWVQED